MSETQRVEDIRAIGKMHGCEREAESAIASGMNFEQFRRKVLDIVSRRDEGPVQLPDPYYDKRSADEKHDTKTPFVDAIFAQMPDQRKSLEGDRGAETHQELVKLRPERTNRRGMIVPIGSLGTRALSTNVGPSGGYLVSEDLVSSSFIELLTNETVAIKMGAKVLNGLVGDVAIPKQTGGSTAYWVGEGEDLTVSQQTLGQIRMTPHTVGGYVDLTRRMLLQSSIDIENFVKQDLARQIGIAVDSAILAGTGTNAQPLGILNISGIGSVATGAVSLAKMIELVQDLADANALRGSLGFAMDSETCGDLCQTPYVSGTDSRMLMDEIPAAGEHSKLLGHKALVSNQLSSQIVFGDWSQVVVGFWSGLDVIVDQTTLGTSGGVRIIAFLDLDVCLRHAESFSSLTVS